MTYAYLIEGLDYEKREELDRALAKGSGDEKAKAAQERGAVRSLMNMPGVVGGR